MTWILSFEAYSMSIDASYVLNQHMLASNEEVKQVVRIKLAVNAKAYMLPTCLISFVLAA